MLKDFFHIVRYNQERTIFFIFLSFEYLFLLKKNIFIFVAIPLQGQGGGGIISSSSSLFDILQFLYTPSYNRSFFLYY